MMDTRTKTMIRIVWDRCVLCLRSGLCFNGTCEECRKHEDERNEK